MCSKHGLMIGSLMAGPVRFLMILTAPISWPVSKLLDTVLGGDHASLFRRKQLKVRVGERCWWRKLFLVLRGRGGSLCRFERPYASSLTVSLTDSLRHAAAG